MKCYLIYIWLTKYNLWLKACILANKSKTGNNFKKAEYSRFTSVTDKKD